MNNMKQNTIVSMQTCNLSVRWSEKLWKFTFWESKIYKRYNVIVK